MKAEIITIGDEILIGQIVDTNSAWIAARLNEAGFTVVRKLTVGDDRREIADAVEGAMRTADAVIVTGGLGPTKDDITKQTLAGIFGGEMVRDRETYERNGRILAARGIEYNELNREQATVPSSAEVLQNMHGTAPGMWFTRGGKAVVSLPGVPFEMKELMETEVMPRLAAHFRQSKVVHRTAITYGLAESVLAATIAEWEAALPGYLHLAYLPSPSQIRLRLSAYDIEGRREEEEIERQFGVLERLIPDYFIGYGDATVASATADLLRARRATLAVAESCTGGALSASFTAMAGASDYYLGGVVSYSNDVKVGILGVSPDTLRLHGAVSEQTACEMAEGVRRLCGADYALSTTGVAGPTGGTPEKPVGTEPGPANRSSPACGHRTSNAQRPRPPTCSGWNCCTDSRQSNPQKHTPPHGRLSGGHASSRLRTTTSAPPRKPALLSAPDRPSDTPQRFPSSRPATRNHHL